MRKLTLTQLRGKVSRPFLTTLLSGGEEPIVLTSGRGKNKKDVAVLMSYEKWQELTNALATADDLLRSL